ncbi:MAG: prepilin peptidase [Acidobacteriota bacterium]|nr:prepilin peptidase [Acidobacteriota bacterium]
MTGIALAAIWGLAIGSFLNVCIHRLPAGGSVVHPPSHCPNCQHQLAWFENVPVLSYVVLRGRCRQCRTPISPMYPLVELATALVFVTTWLQVGLVPLLFPRLVFASALIALFMIDLRHHLLPNVITLPGIVLGFVLSFTAPPGWRASLIGIIAGGGVLLLIAKGYELLRKEEGLGMGDVKMLAMIGAFLGWPLMLVTLVLSSVAGSVVGIGLLATRRGGLKYALPFGTFLALGALAAAAFGDRLLAWYLGFF